MNTESCDCRKVADYDAMEHPGDFYFHLIEWKSGVVTEALHIKLPDGCLIAIGVSKGEPLLSGEVGQPIWRWDGNEDKPTLTPSINTHDHWHGFLTAGRLISC